jgi:hypothetical protein
MQWMREWQGARRNWTPEQESYYRGLRYNEEKTEGHGAKTAYHNDTQNGSRSAR